MGLTELFKQAGDALDALENGVREGERVWKAAAPVVGRVKILVSKAERVFRSSFSPDLLADATLLGLSLPTDYDAIEIAFKAVAKTAHPDKGGSDDQFKRVLAARDRLRKNFPRFP